MAFDNTSTKIIMIIYKIKEKTETMKLVEEC